MADELRQVAEMEKFGAKAHQLRRVSAEVASYVVAGLPATDEGMAETAAKLDQTTNEARRPVRPMVTHADTPNGLRPLTADDIDLLNVKELKSMLVHYGVPFKGFLEKAEFVAAIRRFREDRDLALAHQVQEAELAGDGGETHDVDATWATDRLGLLGLDDIVHDVGAAAAQAHGCWCLLRGRKASQAMRGREASQAMRGSHVEWCFDDGTMWIPCSG